jgi:hypothetical protein
MKKTILITKSRYLRYSWPIVFVMAFIFMAGTTLSGCAKKIPQAFVPEYEKRNIRLVAVLPVTDKAGNPEVSALLRQKMIEGLYFKSYPKIQTKVIDEKLATFFKNAKGSTTDTLPPRDVGAILGVDAVLYVTLRDCKTSFLYLYAPTSVMATFEMYHAKTGELLWKTSYTISQRNFDITPDRVRMKSCQVFEPVLQDIVNKAMETLPEGAGA